MFKDDILNVFLIGIVTVTVLISLFGGRLIALSKYMATFFIFGVFVALFLAVSSFKIKAYKQLEQKARLEELLVFLTSKDIFRDYLINIFIGLTLLVIPLITNIITLEDTVQAASITIFYFIWHRLIYKKKQAAIDAISLNKRDRIMDEIVISLIPVFILIIAIILAEIDITDFIQAITVLIIAFVWHKIIFNRAR